MTKDEYIKKACCKCKQPTMEVKGGWKVCSKCGFRTFISKTATAKIGKVDTYFLSWEIKK